MLLHPPFPGRVPLAIAIGQVAHRAVRALERRVRWAAPVLREGLHNPGLVAGGDAREREVRPDAGSWVVTGAARGFPGALSPSLIIILTPTLTMWPVVNP